MSQPQPPARRGLGALIQSTTGARPNVVATPSTVPISSVRANPDQPRKTFEEGALTELTDSIKAKGILQPIIVRALRPDEIKGELRYEIIAGERRWRASQRVGLTEVPVVIKDVASTSDVLLLSLIENLQRDNLNPIEEAQAFRHLQKTFNLTQESIAAAVGKSRAVVANALRLLDLSQSMLEAVRDGRLSVGHAKILLSLGDEQLQVKVGSKVIAEGLSVRQLESFTAGEATGAVTSHEHGRRPRRVAPPHIQDIEAKLRTHFGTKVYVQEGAKKGKIVVEFYSVEDFDRITKLMGLLRE